MEEVRRLVAAKPCITRDELAEAFCLCPDYLGELYGELTGMPLDDFLRGARLDHAVHLLFHSQQRIKEITAACGFLHIASFCRAFAEDKGMSPSAYRSAFQNLA